MKQGKNQTIREGLEQYIRWCKLKNYAEETIRFYEWTIHNLSLYCDLDQPLQELNADLVERYTLHLREKGLSATTIHCYMRGLKTIVNHLINKGLVEGFEIIVPKSGECIKEIYTEIELKKLLKKMY